MIIFQSPVNLTNLFLSTLIWTRRLKQQEKTGIILQSFRNLSSPIPIVHKQTNHDNLYCWDSLLIINEWMSRKDCQTERKVIIFSKPLSYTMHRFCILIFEVATTTYALMVIPKQEVYSNQSHSKWIEQTSFWFQRCPGCFLGYIVWSMKVYLLPCIM